jgi:hypothetical protein
MKNTIPVIYAPINKVNNLFIKPLFIIFFMQINGCSLNRFIYEPQDFHKSISDNRIFYESGGEDKSKIIEASLNELINIIEKKQYRPFANPIKIFIFSNLENYEKYSPSKNSGGVTFGDMFIILSPKKENTSERIIRVLTHELSHFHLFGYTGFMRSLLLPHWFTEGLAVWASDGGGAENISEEEAKKAILNNSMITPVYHEYFFWEKKSHPKGMATHMFYRQSAMFIKFLYESDEKKFKKLLYQLQDKKDLEYTINFVYKKSLDLLWLDFVNSLK